MSGATVSIDLLADRRTRRRRVRRVTVALCGVLLVAGAASLALGAYAIGPGDLIGTLLGHGTAADSFIVLRLRLPRLTLAVLVGIAFALSGGLFQTVLPWLSPR